MKAKPFKFKQFTIIQENSAMKVGTDGVLLGSWSNPINAEKILDIGCGTGLIALMLAQRSKAEIIAIEIDSEAADEARLNFYNSHWKDRLKVVNDSVQQFSKNTNLRFDLIVSNPPYFDTKLEASSRNTARRQHHLTLEDLFLSSTKILKKSGKINFILPYEEFDSIKQICSKHNLFINRLLLIRGNKQGSIKRIILDISYLESQLIREEISIEKEKRHDYSEEYTLLLKDYLTIF